MNIEKWALISSQHVLRDRWISVRADTCRMPGGQLISPYYVLEYPDFVHAVAITKDEQIVLERQYRHASGKIVLELPGGVVDKEDPSPEEAMRRELLKETGYGGGEIKFLGNVCPNPASSTTISHCFLVTGIEKKAQQQLDASEQIEILLYPLDQAMDLVGHPDFVQAIHVANLVMALQALGRLSTE